MIPLTRETIDNIFEPRRPIRTDEELKAACGRLLADDKGNVFCINKTTLIDEYRGRYVGYEHKVPNHAEPGYVIEWGQRKLKKGTWPVWITSERTLSNMNLPEIDLPCWELLPGPTHQMEYIIAFYRLAFPDWDDIVKIDGWPRVSEKTWKYIWDKAAAFDARYHPDVMRGGAWALGSGFSSAHHDSDKATVPDWFIDLSPATVAYKWTPFRCSICRTDNEYEGHQRSRWATYIEWDIWLARGDGEKWRMSESVDPTHNDRAESLEQAMDQCAARAGCLLKFEEVPPHNEHITAEWQSGWVQTQKEGQRAA